MIRNYKNNLKNLLQKGENQGKEARFFFFSQYFVDAIRMTLAILLPTIILAQFNQFDNGLVISLAAFCVSITDIPGPVKHKRNGMFYCSLIVALVAFITGFARLNTFILGFEIVILSFLFSMFLVFGNRAGAVGSASLLMMILTMDEPLQTLEVLIYSGLAFLGGIWYMLLSLAFSSLQPYRPAQRALGECIHEVAKYFRIKAEFYNTEFNLENTYSKLIAQQVIVSEKQDAVRELLFKSRQIVKEATSTSRILILCFRETVDLFEDVMATYYDYNALHEKYKDTSLLNDISKIVISMATELDNIGFAIQSNSTYKINANVDAQLKQLKVNIQQIDNKNTTSTFVAKKILINLRKLNKRLDNILNVFAAKQPNVTSVTGKIDYSKFVSHQRFNLKALRDNLTLDSAIFKHAIRVATVCLAAYIVTKTLNYGEYSYWVLLTAAFILKPAFSLSKQRNYQRIIGTVIGGIIGGIILVFISNTTIQFIFLLFFMIGTYSFLRTNYILMVIFVTPYVLILFKFMGVDYVSVIQERLIDTFIGAAIALTATYLIFPNWEKEHLKTYMKNVLLANINYLKKLLEMLEGKEITTTDYKLVRKEVYVNSANLSSAFHRMLSEPKGKQKNRKAVHQFVVLNHLLSSNIAILSSAIMNNEKVLYPQGSIQAVLKTIKLLNNSLEELDPQNTAISLEFYKNIHQKQSVKPTEDDLLLAEQLGFIHKVSNDICKVTKDYNQQI